MLNSNKRRALGRGLTNLIPVETDDGRGDDEVVFVDINAIRANPFQPRQDFDKEEIDGLARSIAQQGLLQPILLRKREDCYEIISGERRFRALKQLGNDKVPCLVKPKITDHEMIEMALVENIQREDLNDIEQACAYQRLMLECGLSHEEISQKVGKARSTVTNFLRLLKLPDAVQEMLRRGELTMGHARALLAVEDPQKQQAMADKIVSQSLTVRDMEESARNENATKQEKLKARQKRPASLDNDPDIQQQSERLRYRFGTMVNILRSTGTRGKLEIHFYSMDDLNRILELLLPPA